MQQKNVKNKLSWTQRKRNIETKLYRIRYNWKSTLVRITILLFESIILLIFNFNLGKISWLNKVNNKFQILALNKLVGFEINFIYYLVYVLTLVPIAVTIRLSFKPVSYTEYDEKMELVFKPENKEENKNLIPPSFIVKYPNKEDADTTIYMFYKNSYTKEEIDTKWETIRNHFSLYVKYTEDYGTDKILIYLTKNNPLYPKTITFNDKCLNDLKRENNDSKKNPINDLKIIIGKNGAGKYQWWNASRNVHAKITGATRMGKTKFQKCICVEFLLLNTGGLDGVGGNRLYVYDGKGIDYQGIWKELYNCTILNTELGLLNTLIILDYEHERRTKLLDNKTDTIDKYNLKQEDSDKIPHIMLVIEEAADIFDKDFSIYPKETKEEKEILEREKVIHGRILYYIEKLIRKGGATSTHIILNSQKLTKTNLPKSVPTNINENWSAYVDSVTSEIVVGNTDANELLNKDAKGMFVNDNHEVIQGYLIDEDSLLYELSSGHKIDGDLQVARYVEDIEDLKNREINFY